MAPYPIGIAGQPWAAAEIAQWRDQQTRQRSYAQDVLKPLQALRSEWDVFNYGELAYGSEHFPLMAARSRAWRDDLPHVLITGGVHGYETSGVQGALRFLQTEGQHYAANFNLLVVPCVSPWSYERIQRWNADAVDPNRSFRAEPSACLAPESRALVQLVQTLKTPFVAHVDLHETTDTDESEFRPALAARDGKAFEPCAIPDGFYLVADTARPHIAFQQAIIAAVKRITHIAEADAQACLIGSPEIARGVIQYDMQSLGLCASITSARYTTTTEVYPDSPRTSPEQCVLAQVAAVCAGLDFLFHQPVAV
jgi:hypothetical protein